MRKDAGLEDKASAASAEFQKNIAAMRKMVLRPNTNSEFDQLDRNKWDPVSSRTLLPDRTAFGVQGANDPVSGHANTSGCDLGAVRKS